LSKKIGKLFLSFLKLGAITFGGGYVMIALMENEFVEKKHLLTQEEYLDMVAIAESSPGPVAVNAATYIGYRLAGIAGSAIATVGVVLPAFIIIFIISLYFDAFLALKPVQYAFAGIRVCVPYLIFSAGLRMAQKMEKTVWNKVIFFSVMTAMILCSLLAVKLTSILCILMCGTAGLAAWGIARLRDKKEGKHR